MTDRWDPQRARDALVDGVDELALIWPALRAALAADGGHAAGSERVATSGNVLASPINPDVLWALSELGHEIPYAYLRYRATVGDYTKGPVDVLVALRNLPRIFDRAMVTHAQDVARELAADVARWLRLAKVAVGLIVHDRKLGELCPLHDEPVVELVAPGDVGWLLSDHGALTVAWQHVDQVLCRHCRASWTPGRYWFLGRLLRDAVRRRRAATEQAAQLGEAS